MNLTVLSKIFNADNIKSVVAFLKEKSIKPQNPIKMY